MNNIIPINFALSRRGALKESSLLCRPERFSNSQIISVPPFFRMLFLQSFLASLSKFADEYKTNTYSLNTNRNFWQQFSPEQRAKVFEQQIRNTKSYKWKPEELN